jgi:hypothetical protein
MPVNLPIIRWLFIRIKGVILGGLGRRSLIIIIALDMHALLISAMMGSSCYLGMKEGGYIAMIGRPPRPIGS